MQIGPCKNCGAGHNILLCTKNFEGNDSVLRMNDLDNSISGSAEDIDDCGPDTADSVSMAKGGRLATRVKPATVRVKQIAKMARTQERRKIKTNTRKEHRKKFKDRIQHLRKNNEKTWKRR